MGMKKPFVIEIAKNTYAINEFGMDAMYLVIGRDRALLIDTGTGTFDLAESIGLNAVFEGVAGYRHEWDFWDLSIRKGIRWFLEK